MGEAASGCIDIARQLIEWGDSIGAGADTGAGAGDGAGHGSWDVALGGGRRSFFPIDTASHGGEEAAKDIYGEGADMASVSEGNRCHPTTTICITTKSAP